MKPNGNRRLHALAVAGGLAVLAAAVPAGAQNWFLPQTTTSEPATGQPAGDARELAARIERLEETVRRLASEVELLRRQFGDATADAIRPPRIAGQAPAPRVGASPAGESQTAEAGGHAVAEGPPTSLLPLPQPGSANRPLADSAARRDPPRPTAGASPSATGTVERSALPALPGPPAEALLRGRQEGTSRAQVASLPEPADDGAGADYAAAYQHLLAEDMERAGAAFAAFLSRHPNHELAGNAQYWLAETHFARGDYTTAARGFLTGYTKYAASPKAPDSLIKLGLTLAALGETAEACASFAEVAERFPNADPAVFERAATERANAGC